MFGGASSWLASLMAQPVLTAIGAGLIAGAMTGTTLVVTGILPDRPDPELSLLSCYHDGRAIARAGSGVSMLVTARSPDGAWLEVYIGVSGAERGWAPAAALKLGASTDSLPVGECVGNIPFASLGPPPTPGPTAEPSAAIPSAVATAVPATGVPSAVVAPTVTPRPTPRPTRTPKVTPLPPPPTIPPTPVPTPVPTADTFAPSVSAPFITSPGAYVNGSYYVGHNPCSPPSATIRVTASDPSGLNYVRLYYLPPGGTFTFGTMTFIGNNTFEYVITPPNAWPQGEIGLWAQAQDGLGNTSGYVPFGNPYSTSDVSLFWNPICVT